MNYIPTELLHTFIAVAEQGGFTQAGDIVGRSQPAVSLQIKRLEEIVGTALFNRSNKNLELTTQGTMLLQYARDIMSLNKEVMAKLSGPKLEGCLRLGIPNEYASSFLPEILGKFAQTHPNVALKVTCDLSVNLMESFRQRALDLVFALSTSFEPIAATDGWSENLVWVTSQNHTCHTRNPLPLIVAPEGCVYRHRIIQALNRAEIPWRIAYTCASYSGIRAGVLAGLGVTALGESIVPEGLRQLKSAELLPELSAVQMRLFYNRQHTPEAVSGFVQFIAESEQMSGEVMPLLGA
ncbi:LysR family transcriptional regulator [Hahella sp. CCB-MM4]|uniref:LysR substrate-binding domain-containing protein n=1 Tax=Hahella sp. (strain CCB-MM4) TaxID=1926491 RepID=UPI000B9C3ACE|nr:LysR substrate-binding domain-containing protein [Hahella sp. CCB-MM4]OZG71801.1 LysR family transcriptional regulator [Hahella sp. CCB-MM4]